MYKLVLSLVLSSLFVTSALASVGGKTPLTADELNSSVVQGLSETGLTSIKRQKLETNSLPSCVDLTGKVTSGTKQLVAGISYDLIIEVEPVKSSNTECASANVDVAAVPKETCTVNVWVKPGTQGTVVDVKECEEV